MDPLEYALDVATRMRQALQAELEAAREQRVLVRKLDVQGLFERARQRGELNVKLAQMQDALAAALGDPILLPHDLKSGNGSGPWRFGDLLEHLALVVRFSLPTASVRPGRHRQP